MTCRRCDHPIVPQSQHVRWNSAARRHEGRGLCTICYRALRDNDPDALLNYPRANRSRDELLDEYRVLRGLGLTQTRIAERLGMTLSGLEQALIRARRAGGPVAS